MEFCFGSDDPFETGRSIEHLSNCKRVSETFRTERFDRSALPWIVIRELATHRLNDPQRKALFERNCRKPGRIDGLAIAWAFSRGSQHRGSTCRNAEPCSSGPSDVASYSRLMS